MESWLVDFYWSFIYKIVTVLIGLFHDPNPFATGDIKGPPYVAFDSMVKWSGFSAIFSSSVVGILFLSISSNLQALTFHYNIPDLIGEFEYIK